MEIKINEKTKENDEMTTMPAPKDLASGAFSRPKVCINLQVLRRSSVCEAATSLNRRT